VNPGMLDVAGVAHRNDVPGEVQRWHGPGPFVSNRNKESKQITESGHGLSRPAAGAQVSNAVRCTHGQVAQLVRELPLK